MAKSMSLMVDPAGNVVGIDPHKRTLTATVADRCGGIVASEHFRISGDGHRALEAWALQFGAVARWGVEGACGWGRHTAIFLIDRGHDVRDVCANRTPRCDRARQRGKSDRLDSERIARETLAHPRLPQGVQARSEGLGPWRAAPAADAVASQRRSIVNSRQHLLGEAESMLCELPLMMRETLPDSKAVRPRLAALARRNRRRRHDPPTRLRLKLLDAYREQIATLDVQEQQVIAELAELVQASGSTLAQYVGSRPCWSQLRTAGRGRRPPTVHRARVRALQRLSPVASLHCGETGRAGPTPLHPGWQPADEPDPAHDGSHSATLGPARPGALCQRASTRTHQEGSRRILKRHLSDVIYRRMILDLERSEQLVADPRLLAA